MAEEVGVKVGVQVDGQATLKQLRQDLKTAQGEALALSKQFGETSKEAMAAAKRVAEIKDQMADLNERVALLDPGAKFQVFGNAINTIAAGFTAAQGAMAAFGAESEEVQESLLKVQGALALSQGLSTLTDSWKDFERLGAVIKTKVVTALTTLRGALIATGIGAAVVAVGALVANFEKVEEWLKKIIPGFEGFTKAFNRLKAVAAGVLNGIIESFKVIGEVVADIFSGDFSEALDTARGAGKRIGAAYNEGFQEEVKDQADEAARNAVAAQIKADEAHLRILRAGGEKRLKEAEALEKKIARARIDAEKAGSDEQREAIIAFAELLEKQRTEQALKAEQQRKEAGQKALQALQEQHSQEYEIEKIRGTDLFNLKSQQLQAQLDLAKKYGLDLAALQAQQTDEEIAKRAAVDEILTGRITARDQKIISSLTNVAAASDALTNKQIQNNKSLELSDQAREQVKVATETGMRTAMEGTAALAESLAGLAGEQTAAGKALAIAGTTINTYQAAMQAYLNGQMIGGPYGIIAGVLAAAAAVATGIANVKRIVAVQIPGGKGSGSGSTPSGVSAPTAPVVRRDTGTMIDQLAQVNSNLNQPGRIQVVESDITNTQNRVEVIENNAKF